MVMLLQFQNSESIGGRMDCSIDPGCISQWAADRDRCAGLCGRCQRRHRGDELHHGRRCAKFHQCAGRRFAGRARSRHPRRAGGGELSGAAISKVGAKRGGGRRWLLSAVQRQLAKYSGIDRRQRSGTEKTIRPGHGPLRSRRLWQPPNSLGGIGQIHNGADDNASGDAGVLETSRLLAICRSRPNAA